MGCRLGRDRAPTRRRERRIRARCAQGRRANRGRSPGAPRLARRRFRTGRPPHRRRERRQPDVHLRCTPQGMVDAGRRARRHSHPARSTRLFPRHRRHGALDDEDRTRTRLRVARFRRGHPRPPRTVPATRERADRLELGAEGRAPHACGGTQGALAHAAGARVRRTRVGPIGLRPRDDPRREAEPVGSADAPAGGASRSAGRPVDR